MARPSSEPTEAYWKTYFEIIPKSNLPCHIRCFNFDYLISSIRMRRSAAAEI